MYPINPHYCIHELPIQVSPRRNEYNFDILEYLSFARAVIKKNHIDGIFFNTDLGSLVAAILCEEFGFPGPSKEAAWRCYHKGESRKRLGGISCYCVPVHSNKHDMPYPYYLKAPLSSFGILGFTIKSESDLRARLRLMKKEIPKMTAPIRPLVEAELGIKIKDEVLLEELITGLQVTVEGYVYRGESQITVITDTNLKERLIENFSVPSKLPAEEIKRLESRAAQDALKLGLNNTFFNIEYCLSDGSWKLIEANCRAATCFKRLYWKALGYDVIRAAFELCLGRKPHIRIEPRATVAQYNVFSNKPNPLSEHGIVLRQFEEVVAF